MSDSYLKKNVSMKRRLTKIYGGDFNKISQYMCELYKIPSSIKIHLDKLFMYTFSYEINCIKKQQIFDQVSFNDTLFSTDFDAKKEPRAQ